ncbi:major facilitator superfamily domain-containing protein [Elsinoe ampelina]|uniref:Major facilitator superfamily domain-containing protein n=1 Tax=Elsinoe ampelina TaxID=302913 RepID=A0A6A6GQH7_9PEZI|nr:major facilitator superfamily domain-containing protein [Elsinoe ampelina]
MAEVTSNPAKTPLDVKDEEKIVEQVAPPPSTAAVVAPEYDIPDGGYGWVCIACVAMVNFNTWGCATSYGIYLAYYLNANIFPGASALDFALIGGLQFAISMLLAPIVTPTSRRLKTRPTMAIGIVIMSLGYILAGFANGRVWVLYLTQGFMVGSGLSFIFVPASAVLPQWFWRRRTMSVGLTSAGAGLGGLVYSLATDPMIRNLGLPWALRITGIVAFCCNTVATIFLRDRNKIIKPTQHGFAVYLLKRKRVLLLLGHAFFVMLGYISVLYSISSFALSLGIDQRRASLATAFLNLGTTLGRPFVGLASDRFGRFKVAFWCTFVSGILCFALWLPTNSYGLLVFLTITIGLIMGSFWTTISALTAEVVGIKEVPSALSLVWLSIVLPTAFSEVIALYLRKPPGSSRQYLYVQIFSGLSYFVSATFMLILWRTKKAPAGP